MNAQLAVRHVRLGPHVRTLCAWIGDGVALIVKRIRILRAEGDPSQDDLTLDRIDVTHRVLMEALRMSPIVAM